MARPSSSRPAAMLVLDLDGVVTNPESGEINNEVLGFVASDLKRGEPVAFNTGRTLDWVEQHILPRLSEACTPRELEMLLIVAEKGGVLGFIEEGNLRVELDLSLAPPEAFTAAVRALIEGPDATFAETMFWDGAKQTMVSIERRPEAPLPAFETARKELVTELKRLISEHKLHHFSIDATVIATDVEHERAGKHLGAEAVVTWLKQKDLHPQSFVAIGDSPSDAAMADVLARVAPTTFVYVGDSAKYSGQKDSGYKIIMTDGGYAAATAKYLHNTYT